MPQFHYNELISISRVLLAIVILICMLYMATPLETTSAEDEHKLYMGDQSNLDGIARVIAVEWMNRASWDQVTQWMACAGLPPSASDDDIINAKVREILSIAEPPAH